MKQILSLAILLLSLHFAKAQTFTCSTGGPIPDFPGGAVSFPLTVSGVGEINGSYGLERVCINILHTYDGDLTIKLKSPDGTIIPLSSRIGSAGDNFIATCLSMNAGTPITAGTASFTGSYVPQGNLGAINNSQNANGTWYLSVQDGAAGDVGSLSSWSLTFNNTPATPTAPVSCSTQLSATNTCYSAPLVCNLNNYCGRTSGYTADSWPELSSAFCGTIENNSFITFVATASTVNLNVWVWSCNNSDGLQMFVFSNLGCSGAVTAYHCEDQILVTEAPPGGIAHNVIITGLTAGSVYNLMIDGFAGDICNYQIAVNSGASPTCVLPVNFFSFDGKLVEDKSELQWQTTTEENTANFIIQYSLDGSSFNSIGSKPAAGSSSSLRTYQFTHPTPRVGNNYYRIKTVEKSGSFSYSNVVQIKMDNRKDIILYPNPARDYVMVEHPLSASGQINIIDMLGRVVISKTINNKSSGLTKITLKNLASGSYKVLWTDGTSTANQTLLVNK
jgi:subtilisin-like proprotein convertase family protein